MGFKRGIVSMTLADAAAFSTALSGFAVTGSIIYLAIQTHQSSKHTRALIQQGATARVTAITIGLMRGELSAAWIEGNGGDPTPAEIRRHQFVLHCVTAVNAMEDLFAQHRDGLHSKEHFERECETFRGLLAQPGFRAFWEEQRGAVGQVAPRFSAFVDSLANKEVTGFTHHV
jgi:hypothetical protein